MKKLRNKKTGEIKDFGNLQVYAETENSDEGQLLGNFDSFKQILEYYEDYIPKEPLIKDEKIRKAVRAWAEASGVGVARVSPFAVFDIETSARIYFYGRVIEDKDYDEEKSYTITELCGEEEE